MNFASVTANLFWNLCCDNFGLSGDKGLANFARLFETLLLRDRIVCCHWNSLTALGWNVDTLLSLNLDWDWNTLLCRDVFADLLAVMASAVVLKVGYSALHVFYRLKKSLN